MGRLGFKGILRAAASDLSSVGLGNSEVPDKIGRYLEQQHLLLY